MAGGAAPAMPADSGCRVAARPGAGGERALSHWRNGCWSTTWGVRTSDSPLSCCASDAIDKRGKLAPVSPPAIWSAVASGWVAAAAAGGLGGEAVRAVWAEPCDWMHPLPPTYTPSHNLHTCIRGSCCQRRRRWRRSRRRGRRCPLRLALHRRAEQLPLRAGAHRGLLEGGGVPNSTPWVEPSCPNGVGVWRQRSQYFASESAAESYGRLSPNSYVWRALRRS